MKCRPTGEGNGENVALQALVIHQRTAVTQRQRDRKDSPRFNVDALLHESAEREPETVEDGEVIGDSDTIRAVLDVPLKRTETTNEEENDTHSDVREHNTHPHLHAPSS